MVKSASRPQVCFVETTSKWFSVQSAYISGSVKATRDDKTQGFQLRQAKQYWAVDAARAEDRRLALVC